MIFMMRESQYEVEDKLVVKAILEGNNLKMFLYLKRKYNLKYNIEVFHTILKKVYDIERAEEQ